MSEPVTVVLVHWNQPERCAATVEAFRGQEGVDTDIIVVDNGSTTPAVDRLRTFGGVTLLALGTNLGFGPAANVGWRHWLANGSGELCALAPHDALPATDCLSRIVDAMSARPGAGLACADVGDGRTPVVDNYFGGMTVPATVAEGWEAAGYPHGTLMVARRGCLQDVGLFDERYFAYCEEADLGERARRAGWDVGLVRGACVTNPHLSGRADVVDYLMLRNTLLLVRKQFGRYRSGIRFTIALLHLAEGLAAPSTRPWIFAPRARARALFDYALGRFGPPPAALTPDRERANRASRTPEARRSSRPR